MDWVDYRQLPLSTGGFSELFFDYLYSFDEVRPFFASDFRDPASFASLLPSLTARSYDRRTLVGVLGEQNASFGAPPKTFDHIALLKKPTTLAVVTGQQVGLFGGPLYTVFKTMTAVKLAVQLKTMFPAYDFVPVFWVEGEDHDFAEMNHTAVLNAENVVVRCEYLPGGTTPERNMGAVGELVFDSFLEQTFVQLEEGIGKTEFSDTVLGMLKGCYRQGRSFNHAFAAWMTLLFQEYGLVFLSPNNAQLKKLCSPIFVREVSEFPRTSQLVITKSAELEERYHAQIKAKSLNLFLFHKGGRYLIEPRETDFSLKGTRHFLTKDDLMRIANETPELLSANVVLRPLTQDSLLPSIAYVAGPSEIAYHAQLRPVYQEFGIPQPVLYPRASASFVEERLRRAMDKYGLDLLEFFGDSGRIVARVVEQISDVKVERIFGDAQRRVQETLNELKFGLGEIDPTLLGALDGVRSKFDGNLAVLKEKASAAQQRRNEAAVRQIERAANGLLPGGTLQERQLNVVQYLNKYGPDLMKWLGTELSMSGFKHQILTL